MADLVLYPEARQSAGEKDFTMTISQSLADILPTLEFDRIPSVAVSSAKKLLLDHLCIAALGASTPSPFLDHTKTQRRKER